MKKTISLVLVLALGLAVEVAKADFTWGIPTNLGPEVNSSYDDAGVCISANGLEFYFASDRPGGHGGIDLWVMKRPTIEDDWGDPMNLGSPANSQYSYWNPSISPDGLSLYFSDGHTPNPDFGNHLPGGLGGQGDIWMITRETIHDAWGAPVNIGPAVNSRHAVHPSISADGLSLYFQSHRPSGLGGCDIMVAIRESTSDSFGNPIFLNNVNSAIGEWMPDISADGRALFFCRISVTELWVLMATRATMYDDFGPPLRLPSQINISSYFHSSPHLSADGRTLFFASDRPGGVGRADLWQVSIEPVVDLNGDGIVDSADMCIMVEHWSTDNPLCDIGPMPWGDGVVDVQDLIVLAENLFEDYRLIAHWELDETEGDMAYDNAGNYHGDLNGNPIWQPAGGLYDGALEFDGNDDYVSTPFVLNPKEEPFSVFTWIKGGAPGQVIISQSTATGNIWLGLDAQGGTLMTGLVPPSSGWVTKKPLVSESIITDDQWHHIGCVWDDSYRILYMDGIEVAKDITAQNQLKPATGGLYIGTDKTRGAETFFSGLIDDVRIYRRALSAEEIAALAQ
ncbi:MAG: LamG-like jellyroll fold domain-containing protein [Planctomycetota bacterium]|jgi:hypothetical protein